MHGEISDFRQNLLTWFRQNGRDLPWRRKPSLYKTVVSEFMLQQTQVDTVLPYFDRWLNQFPDFQVLAGASEQKILKHWEGLGYYSRARNLHKLAKSIRADGIPDSFQDWLKRPGIGPYTAAAISSISQGIPEPVIDGNVVRVLSRLTYDTRPIASSTDARKRFIDLATRLIDPDAPGTYNEAIMELGAVVCRKTRPACLLCPVREHCKAAGSGNPEATPVIQRKPSSRRKVTRLFLVSSEKLLLHFYPQNAPRLAGLAELPELPQSPSAKPILVRSRGISSERIQESIFELQATHPAVADLLALETTKWIPLSRLDRIPLSGPHKQWIQSIIQAKSKQP